MKQLTRLIGQGIGLGVGLGLWAGAAAAEEEAAMWGYTPSRNLVSAETGLATEWDPETGKNIKWSAELGSQSYAGPVIFGDKIFVGTNNQALRNPKLTGDRGNIMAFTLDDGAFLWQSTHTKLPAGRVNDWPQQGICSTPYIVGDRLYYLSNRAELVCVDIEGFRDGENDGPYTDETDISEIDGDIIWTYDLIGELDVFPHNLATSSPMVVGDLLFVVTGNGVDEGHFHIPSPFAPSFVALNRHTGELAWEDASPGENILHGQWGNPTYGEVNGQGQIIFPGGDGWVYAFAPETGELIWKFDANPKDSVWELGGRGTRNNLVSTPVFFDNKVYVGVGQDPEHGEGAGHLWAIDASGRGDVTESHAIWHWGDENYNRTVSTVAINNGLLYAADLSGFVYCLDVETGKHHWTYDTFAALWGSPMVADGRVFIGDEDGDVAVLKEGPGKDGEAELLFEVNMGSSVYTTPVAHEGILYIASRNRLFAIETAAE